MNEDVSPIKPGDFPSSPSYNFQGKKNAFCKGEEKLHVTW